MKNPKLKHPLALRLAVLMAASAALVTTSQAQVTLSQVTNGLASYYPLDYVVTNGTTVTAYDYVGARDMTMVNMNSSKVIASTRPSQNSATVSNCFNFDQGGNGTVTTIMYYQSKGQTGLPLNGTGSGDFLPFCNQVGATMNFWIKANTDVTAGFNDKRFFGECDDGSAAGTSPIWLMGTRQAVGQHAHFLFRQNTGFSGQPLSLVDGTKQLPDYNSFWVQDNSYTAGNIFDQNWHMFTFLINTDRVVDIYIDGVRDAGPGSIGGPQTYTDAHGNPNYGPDLTLTNFYYTTNIYASAGVSNPPPNGYVRWVWNGIFSKGVTTFGGFRRQGGNNGGFPMYIDDIAFWKRTLDTNEIMFVYTNGLTGIPLVRPLQVNSFTADFPEVGKGGSVTLRWNVTGANTTTGGIVISGVGDVSSKGLIGSTNVTLNGDQTFTLSVHNGIAPDTNAVVSVKTFAGVDAGWNLVERFDGVYADTSDSALGGLTANNWISAGGDFSGTFDKWNVVTVTNGGAPNKVLTPRTGYNPNTSALTGYESRGALSYAKLGSLTLQPGKTNTLFFRFSLQEPEPFVDTNGPTTLVSDMDFGVGVSDYNFLGPSGGLGYYGGTGGGLGPYFSILRNAGGNFNGAPFDLFAPDTADTADGNSAATFSYVTSVDPNGLQTNVNYLVWMDIVNRRTAADTANSATTNQALYSVWIQKQGDAARTLLFTNFHGNRNYVAYNPVNDLPTPNLDKVFFNIGNQSFVGAAAGSYIATNMIAIDDIYLSKSGVNTTIPRLFDITSIVKGAGGVTLNWRSLGSLFGTNTYTIQRKFQIDDPNWTTLATIPSGGETTTYVDNTVGNASAAYYRIAWP